MHPAMTLAPNPNHHHGPTGVRCVLKGLWFNEMHVGIIVTVEDIKQ